MLLISALTPVPLRKISRVCGINVNVKSPQESAGGAHLPFLGLEPVGEEPLMCATRG